MTLKWLLYDVQGAKCAESLWRGFENVRRGVGDIGDEEAEEETRELGWEGRQTMREIWRKEGTESRLICYKI